MFLGAVNHRVRAGLCDQNSPFRYCALRPSGEQIAGFRERLPGQVETGDRLHFLAPRKRFRAAGPSLRMQKK